MANKVNPIKVIGYCRVSDIKQKDEGHSLDAQKDIITKYCDKKGFKLTKFYCEQVSGSIKCLERPEFKKIITDLTSKKAQGIVVTKFDRLSRNLRDMVSIIEDYFQNKYVIHFTDFDYIDLNTPNGMLQLNMFSTFAQFERSMISKRTKDVLQYKKSKSEKTGGFIPYGKKVIMEDNNGKQVKKLIDNNEEIKLISELKDLKETKGYSYNDLAKLLMDRGIKNRNENNKWHPQQVYKILKGKL